MKVPSTDHSPLLTKFIQKKILFASISAPLCHIGIEKTKMQ